MKTKTIDAEVVKQELYKFFTLCESSTKPLPMFSKVIDNQWHTIIDNNDTFPIMPHHDSNIRTSEKVSINWIESYESRYGQLNDMWFIQSDGKIDHQQRGIYKSTGNVYASYNCAATNKSC